MTELTVERAKELLNYDPETGVITWRVTTNSRAMAGSRAGCKHCAGYVQIHIDGRKYLAHRLAWLIIHGEWPLEHIDHINGIRNDNRKINLREASRAINMQNQRRPMAGNTSGFLGVSWFVRDKVFAAQIWIQGKKKHIGFFNDPSEAHQAYLAEKRKLHPGCTI